MINSINLLISEAVKYDAGDLDHKLAKLGETDRRIVQTCLAKLTESKEESGGAPPTSLNNKSISEIASQLQESVENLGARALEILNYLQSEKVISQDEIGRLLTEIPQLKKGCKGEKLLLARVLQERGFSTDLHRINFAIPGLTVKPQNLNGREVEPWIGTDLLQNVDFSGLTLTECQFKYVDLSNTCFRNARIEQCDFKEAILKNALFDYTPIKNSSFVNAMAFESSWKNVVFEGSNISSMNFYQSRLEGTRFIECEMHGASFLSAQVADCTVEGGKTDALFFEALPHFEFKEGAYKPAAEPVIALPWNLRGAGIAALRVDQALKRSEGIPLRYNFLPETIDTHLLEEEVLGLIRKIEEEEAGGMNPVKSLAEELLNRAAKNRDSQIYKLILMAKELAAHCDAILLPGGADVQPIFYREEPDKELKPDPDFRRSIFEFAILREANTRGIPMLGICRGSQLANIYYGGSMHQHVPGHVFQVQNILPTAIQPAPPATVKAPTPIPGATGIIRGIMEAPTVGFSIHHQVYKQIGEGLEVVAEFGGVKKALEKTTGSPQILVQWHPEFKGDRESEEARLLDERLSAANREFFDVIVEMGRQMTAKKRIFGKG